MKNRILTGASGDAVVLTGIKLVTIVLGFLITRLLSQYLSVYDYGTYSQILLLVSTISSLTVLGMMDGVNFFYCSERDAEKRESYVATIFALQCMIGAIMGALILLCTGPLCAYFENPDIRKLIVFAALLPTLQNLLGMLQILLVSVGKAKLLAIRNLIVSVLRLAAVIVVVFVAQNVAVILGTTLVLDVIQIALFGVFLRKNQCNIQIRQVNLRLAKMIFSYCLPMAIFTVVNTLNRDLDKYLIAMWTDTETLALYTNASKQLPFDILSASFCTVMLPKITRLISHERYPEATKLYRSFLEIAYVPTWAMCCVALVASPQLMMLLYSNKYTAGLNIFCVYICVDMLRFASITLILSAAGKTKKLMLLGLGTLGMNTVLNFVLFRVAGIIGPAIATFVTSLIMGVLLLGFSAKELKARITDFFDGKYLLLFLVENALLSCLLIPLRRYLERADLHYLWILLVVGSIYGITMLLLNGKRILRNMKTLNGTDV